LPASQLAPWRAFWQGRNGLRGPGPRCFLPRRLPGYRAGQPGGQRCASGAQAPGRPLDLDHCGDRRFSLPREVREPVGKINL
jgi:hypothetical protein